MPVTLMLGSNHGEGHIGDSHIIYLRLGLNDQFSEPEIFPRQHNSCATQDPTKLFVLARYVYDMK